jgi:hypothetical protein
VCPTTKKLHSTFINFLILVNSLHKKLIKLLLLFIPVVCYLEIIIKFFHTCIIYLYTQFVYPPGYMTLYVPECEIILLYCKHNHCTNCQVPQNTVYYQESIFWITVILFIYHIQFFMVSDRCYNF